MRVGMGCGGKMRWRVGGLDWWIGKRRGRGGGDGTMRASNREGSLPRFGTLRISVGGIETNKYVPHFDDVIITSEWYLPSERQ
jgi:hypothetical protein